MNTNDPDRRLTYYRGLLARIEDEKREQERADLAFDAALGEGRR